MKNDALDSAAKNIKEQQKAFDIFRYDFNHYRRMNHLMTKRPAIITENQIGLIRNGCIFRPMTWIALFVKSVIAERLSLKAGCFYYRAACRPAAWVKEITDGIWQIQYSFFVLGSVDLRKNKIIRN